MQNVQGWYIGITAASQAVKAGSTPVPCSMKKPRFRVVFSTMCSVVTERDVRFARDVSFGRDVPAGVGIGTHHITLRQRRNTSL